MMYVGGFFVDIAEILGISSAIVVCILFGTEYHSLNFSLCLKL